MHCGLIPQSMLETVVGERRWRQVYRLLCRRSPLIPEMTMFCSCSNFGGHVPKRQYARSNSCWYNMQDKQSLPVQGIHRVVEFRREALSLLELSTYYVAMYASSPGSFRRRGTHGRGSGKETCVFAVAFPLELLYASVRGAPRWNVTPRKANSCYEKLFTLPTRRNS